MAKVKKVAVHEVEYADGKKRLKAIPDTVFEIDSEHVERLEKLKAIREPTAAELALYEAQNKGRKPKAKAEDADDDNNGADGGEGVDEGKAKAKKPARKAEEV